MFWEQSIDIPNTEDWKIVAVCPPNRNIEFNIIDHNGCCKPITYKHFHHAVLYKNFSDHQAALNQFNNDFKLFCDHHLRLVREVKSIHKNGFLSYEKKHHLIEQLDEIEKDFINWTIKRSPQNIRLRLAIKRLDEATERIEKAKDDLRSITSVSAYSSGYIKNEVKKINDIITDIFRDIEITDLDKFLEIKRQCHDIAEVILGVMDHKPGTYQHDKNHAHQLLIDDHEMTFSYLELIIKKCSLEKEIIAMQKKHGFNLPKHMEKG